MRTWLQNLEVFVFLRKPNLISLKILAGSKRWFKAISNINGLIFSPTLTEKKHAALLPNITEETTTKISYERKS